MADKKQGEVPDERTKNAVSYDINTSEIKDDLAALASCLKTGNGVLNRQEGGFLLWHHALQGEDSILDIANNGGISASLSVLDNPDCSNVEKSCAAGILAALTKSQASLEQLVRSRVNSNSCTNILHAQLDRGGDNTRQHSLTVLRALAEDATARTYMLKSLEQRPPFPLYVSFLKTSKDSTAVALLAHFVKALIHGREDLKGAASEGGLPEALIGVLVEHKAEATACGAVSCLIELADMPENWQRIISAGGISVLVDLMGPPPASIMRFEMEHYAHLLAPAGEAGKRETDGGADQEEQRRHSSAEGEAAAKLEQKPNTSNTAKRSTVFKEAVAPNSEKGSGRGVKFNKEEMAATEKKRVSPPHYRRQDSLPSPSVLLSRNSAALKWHSNVTLPTLANAAGVLYHMAERPETAAEISRRLAASRAVALLITIVTPPNEGKKKKTKGKKKKGLDLSPEQIDALVFVTGLLKFLSLTNINRYRIAKSGAIEALVMLYEESGRLLVRRNSQVVLANLALLAENGQLLKDGGLPEEFLVPVPMRLAAQEVEQLLLEFPDSALTVKSPSIITDA